MKNACIVLKNCKERVTATDYAPVDRFLLGGFAFEEIRLLSKFSDEPCKKALSELWQTSDNLLLLAEKALLGAVRKLVCETLACEFFQGTPSGSGICSKDGKTLFLLSCDDSEGGADYASSVCVPYLNQKYGIRTDKTVLRAIGASDEHVRSLLEEGRRLCADKIRFHRERALDEDILQIVYDSETPKMLVDDVLRHFVNGLGDNLYALDDTTIEERLVQLLSLRGYKIGVAESFTGGGVGKRIVSVSGASKVYYEGINAYDEIAKQKRLGVSDFTLKTFGAVSDRAAYEMAAGILASGQTDVAIATTGIAGPKSDRTDAPVGLAFIAVGDKEKIYVYRYKFDGSRGEITEKAINYALYLAYNHLKKI